MICTFDATRDDLFDDARRQAFYDFFLAEIHPTSRISIESCVAMIMGPAFWAPSWAEIDHGVYERVFEEWSKCATLLCNRAVVAVKTGTLKLPSRPKNSFFPEAVFKDFADAEDAVKFADFLEWIFRENIPIIKELQISLGIFQSKFTKPDIKRAEILAIAQAIWNYDRNATISKIRDSLGEQHVKSLNGLRDIVNSIDPCRMPGKERHKNARSKLKKEHCPQPAQFPPNPIPGLRDGNLTNIRILLVSYATALKKLPELRPELSEIDLLEHQLLRFYLDGSPKILKDLIVYWNFGEWTWALASAASLI